MKQFKRVSALIMAAALIFGLLPSGILSTKTSAVGAVAGENYLHASYSAAVIKVDGNMKEAAYQRSTFLPGGKMSVAWDQDNLYVAAETAITALTINGVAVELAEDAKEVKIPFGTVGILDLTKTYAFSVKIGNMEAAWNAALIFDTYVYGTHINPVSYSPYFGGEKLEDAILLDTWYSTVTKTEGEGEEATEVTVVEAEAKESDRLYDGFYCNSSALTGIKGNVAGTDFVAEVDLTIDKLPQVTDSPFTYDEWSGRQSIKNSIVLFVQDGNYVMESNKGTVLPVGLYVKGGTLYLVSTQGDELVEFAVGAFTEGNKYHLRLEYSYRQVDGETVVDAAYYINGKYIGKANDVYRESFATRVGSAGAVQVFVQGSDYTNVDNRAVVTVENLSAVNATSLAELVAIDRSIHAVYTTANLSLNGSVTESLYKRSIWLNDTLKFGAVWDDNQYLWLGLSDTQIPAISQLMINGQTVTLDSSNSKTTEPTLDAETETYTLGNLEIRLPLADLGITEANKEYTIDFLIGETVYRSKLVLDPLTSAWGNVSTNTVAGLTHVEANRVIAFKNPTSRAYFYRNYTAAAAASAVTVHEFSIAIKELSATSGEHAVEGSRYTAKNAINIGILDDVGSKNDAGQLLEGFKFAFVNKDNKIQLVYAFNGAEGAQYKYVPIDDDATGNYYVRVEFHYGTDADMTVTAKYYINGVLVDTGVDVRVTTGNFGTTATNRAYVYAEASTLDVVASHYAATQPDATIANGFQCAMEGHTGVACEEEGVCTRCNETYTAAHKIVEVDAKEATCTENGYEAYEYCSACDYTTRGEDIPAAHKIVNVDAKEATCTEAGHEAYEYCSACDYTTYVEIPAGHKIVKVDAKEATCTEAGHEAYEYCSACDYTTYVEIPKNDHNYVNGVCGSCNDGDPNYPVVDDQPEAEGEYALGDTAEFTFSITGDGLTYQWFYSTDNGETWLRSYDNGNQTNTLSFLIQAYRNGRQYKCIATDAYGNKVESDPVTVVLQTASVKVTGQSSDVETMVGEKVTFQAFATGKSLTYQWFTSANGWQNWTPVEGATEAEYSFAAEQIAWYMCRVTDGSGASAWTKVMKLTAKNEVLDITTQPVADEDYALGATAAFTVATAGDGVTYQWYYSVDGGDTWLRSYDSGCQTATLSFQVQAYRNGRQYKCVVTDAYGYKDETQSVTVHLQTRSVQLTGQLSSIGINRGESTVFEVSATGRSLNYQWYVGYNGWGSFEVLEGATDATLTIENATVSAWYKCRVTDGSGAVAWTNNALLWFYANRT